MNGTVLRLGSNDGATVTELFVSESRSERHAGQYVCTISIVHSPTWEPPNDSGAKYSVRVADVAVERHELMLLAEHCRRFVAEARAFQVTLGSHFEKLFVDVQPRDSWISSSEKPVCRVRYRSRWLVFASSAIVDQSCLEELRVGLERLLQATA